MFCATDRNGTNVRFGNVLNILRILPPKNENFQMKNSGSIHVSAQNRLGVHLSEAVLTSTHNLYF